MAKLFIYPDELLEQITDDLKSQFNIIFDLTTITPNSSSSYREMKDMFNIEDKTKSLTINDIFTKSTTTLTFTNSSTNKTETFNLMKDYTLASGGFNIISKYTSTIDPTKIYIFREAKNTVKNTPFDCFYENLKHIILYIIMYRYNNQNKVIPKPIGIGVINGTTNIGFLSESGDLNLEEYCRKNIRYVDDNSTKSNKDKIDKFKKILFRIFDSLYNLNKIPGLPILHFQHSDIKLENIVLLNSTTDPYPLIIDFGFSSFKLGNIFFICPSPPTYANKLNVNKDINTQYYFPIVDFLTLLFDYYKKDRNSDLKLRYMFSECNYENNVFNHRKLIELFTNKDLEAKYWPGVVYNQLFNEYIINLSVTSTKILALDYNIEPIGLKRCMGIKDDLIMDKYTQKYLKYKQKYLQLKSYLNI